MKKSNVQKLLIVFLLAAVFVIVLCFITLKNFGALEKSQDSDRKNNIYNSQNDSLSTSVSQTTGYDTDNISETDEYENRYEIITSHIGKEKKLKDNVLLTNETDSNTYKTSLSYFLNPNETVDSFTFTINSEDGNNNIGFFEGTIGYSLLSGCPAVGPGVNWIQCPNESLDIQVPSAEITLKPDNGTIDFINRQGNLMFGRWVSECGKINVSSIVCNKTYKAEVEVDGSQTMDVSSSLDFNGRNDYSFPASMLTGPDDYINTISYHVSSEGEIGKCSFEIVLKDRNGKEHPLKDAVQIINSDNADITWILPDNIVKKADDHSIFIFKYYWSNHHLINIDRVSVTYNHTSEYN